MPFFEWLVIKYLRLIASITMAILIGKGCPKDLKKKLISRLEDLSKESGKFLERR